MKLTIRNDEKVDVVLNTKPGEKFIVKPGEEQLVDTDVLLVHRDMPNFARYAHHGIADAAGVPSHSGSGAPYPVEQRLAQALDKLRKAVRGE